MNPNNYKERTDKYFLRTKQILEKKSINPIVRYQIFARTDIPQLKGIEEAVQFVKDVAGPDVKIHALREGQSYQSKEPMLKIEGRVQSLVDLETCYLQILSGNLTGEIDMQEVGEKAQKIVQAAQDKPVLYFGARHFHYDLDQEIAQACKEAGFVGCSTDVGAKAWEDSGKGTIPHSLILSYLAHQQQQGLRKNTTLEAAKGFDEVIDSAVPRIVLIDTFNREIYDSLECAKIIKNLSGIRVDTCGENYAQGSQSVNLPNLNVPEKYLRGKGVTIAGVWALRRALDKEGFGSLELTVSSGFNEKKTAAFMEADRAYQDLHGGSLFDNIGTGSIANPIMTTSDIVAYRDEGKQIWIPCSKIGRGETYSQRLEEVQ